MVACLYKKTTKTPRMPIRSKSLYWRHLWESTPAKRLVNSRTLSSLPAAWSDDYTAGERRQVHARQLEVPREILRAATPCRVSATGPATHGACCVPVGTVSYIHLDGPDGRPEASKVDGAVARVQGRRDTRELDACSHAKVL